MNLTQKILSFQHGKWCLGNILSDIRRISQNWLRHRKMWNAEQIDDFFDFIRPKLIRMIYRYQYSGTQFGRYLGKMLHFQLRSYLRDSNTRDRNQRQLSKIERGDYQTILSGHQIRTGTEDEVWPESMLPETCLDAESVAENLSLSKNAIPEQEHIRHLEAGTKRLLLLALKKVEFWDDGDIKRLSLYTGIPELHLLGMRMDAYSLNENSLERRDLLRQRRNSAYFKLWHIDTTEEKRNKLLKSYCSTQRQISKLLTSPSHKELSQITGIPKGTVDSNLFNHKNRCLKDKN